MEDELIDDELNFLDRKQIEMDISKLNKKNIKQILQYMPARNKTIKVGIRTWDAIKRLKKENETFDDVIMELLDKRTKERGNNNIKAIKFERKIIFFTWNPGPGRDELGFEFEYNDIKNNKTDFTLDLKIKKIFMDRRILNPSEFFGVDNQHKHFSHLFILVYLKSIALALKKDFKIQFPHYGIDRRFENIALWRQFYYEYSLSQDSFQNDIEEPLRLSEEEGIPDNWKIKIKNSISNKFIQKETNE